jgi:hypothetical protein
MANILSLNNVRNEQTKNTNRWSIKFDGLGKIMTNAQRNDSIALERYNKLYSAFNASSQSNNTATAVQNSLELSLHSVTWPKIEIERQDIYRFNDSMKAVTKFSPMAEMQVVFYDYINGSASAIMYTWQGLVGNKQTGAIGFKETYVCDGYLEVYGPTAPGETTPTVYEKHRIINMYPVDVDLGEHSYEGGEARKVTVLFALDNFYPVEYKNKPLITGSNPEAV